MTKRYLDEADGLDLPRASSTHLVIEWASDRYARDTAPSAATIDQYLGVLWRTGFRRQDQDDTNLFEWAEEDWQSYQRRVMQRAKATDTEQTYSALVSDLLAFAAQRYPCARIPSLAADADRPEAILRAAILRPMEIDALVRGLIAQGGRGEWQLAAVMLLGYYGGMRPIEVVLQQLRDIVVTDDTLMVFVAKSKNAQSRRWIDLAISAPDWAVRWLRNFARRPPAGIPAADACSCTRTETVRCGSRI